MRVEVLSEWLALSKSQNQGYAGEWFFDEPRMANRARRRYAPGVDYVLGPSKRLPGAFLIFFGPEIPAPATLGKTKFTLTQTGEKPQSVEAFNAAFPTVDGYGAVIFQVPTLDAALEGIENVHKFGIANNKTTFAEIEWTAGFAAREKAKVRSSRRWPLDRNILSLRHVLRAFGTSVVRLPGQYCLYQFLSHF